MTQIVRPDDTKAIYGALFIEFCIFAVFYLISHIKDIELNQLKQKRLYGKFDCLVIIIIHITFQKIMRKEKINKSKTKV